MAFYHHGYDLMEREYDRLMEYLEKIGIFCMENMIQCGVFM